MATSQKNYVPASVKWTVIGLLVAGTAFGVVLAFAMPSESGDPNYLRTGMALVQASLSAAAVAIIALFSRPATPVYALKARSSDFLCNTLRDAIEGVQLPVDGGPFLGRCVKVKLVEDNTTSATYNVLIEGGGSAASRLSTHVFFNVYHATAYFYIRLENEIDRHRMIEIFSYERKLAKSLGFSVDETVSLEEIAEGTYLVFSFHKDLDFVFLESPAHQLALAQDLGRIVRSFFITASRNELPLGYVNLEGSSKTA